MIAKRILPFILLLISITGFGQDFKEKREQIKQLKVAFITTEVGLTTEEATKFWPIYNTFDERQFELRHKKMRGFQNNMKDDAIDKMTEKEALAFLNQIENTEEELFNLRLKLIADLKTVLSPTKILKFKKAEDDFNRKLLRQMRDRK
ncbi:MULTISPECIES: sensor of ECF-type sigma factor [Flavobacterium]|uniref:sensor of ECF-type sigma factor n=1 Tax=Flavobacterium TaxID=237 RepID=UPI00086EA90D|nr:MULTISPECIES: sensor of ECF-type sigma factor [Flavobacterium]MBN9284753.1 sensor of ECF-type sigma factor [Flavobacterium sp.]ODS77896.1 MAG: sensor of ECF-type sigma factor [Chryseobacterium sp. SCN 40-13]OJV71255.1 MAG: sensor of ECF-type sigma factor [Flavobacterium sp. 40-81]